MADSTDTISRDGGGTGSPLRVPAARTPTKAAQGISTRMVQLIARYTGRGPTQARTTLNTNLVIVVFSNVMTKAEKTLAGAGENRDVRATRQIFQEMIRDEAREIVEECVGRRVSSVLADVDPENDTAVHVFILEEIPETGDVDVVEVTAE
jgi:uncharacterized protein YbcI